MSKRFVVGSVTGYTINQSSGPSSTGSATKPPSRSFVVLDTHVNYRCMGEFNTNSRTRQSVNERRANELCDRLNRECDEWDAKLAAA